MMMMSLDISRFEIIEAVNVGTLLLVLKVQYLDYRDGVFENTEIMVFVAQALDALRWRRIDPDFRAGTAGPYEAPSPLARFPPSADGWAAALVFASAIHSTVAHAYVEGPDQYP